jgi:hypothetical protein
MTDKEKVLYVRLKDDEKNTYDKAFKKSGLRQHSEFIRMLINKFLKGSSK